MSYQALLFCPDEKTARTVTQVLTELDFAVIPCTEPFAAVKKLMGEHFDAIVVDCGNEQNATLLFKSARSSPINQASLAVAVVEGQVGVAKAFRIGANLVLTKPINVEQAKGTLRVARGLLRKNETGKPASPAGTSITNSTAAAPEPPKRPAQPAFPGVVNTRPAPRVAPPTAPAAAIPVHKAAQPSVMTSAPVEIAATSARPPESTSSHIVSQAVSPSTQSSAAVSSPAISAPHRSTSSAASAPAPARESKPSAPVNEQPSSIVVEPATHSTSADLNHKDSSIAEASSPAALTFGAAVSAGDEPVHKGGNKAIFAAVAVVLIAAASYVAWTQLGRSKQSQSAAASTATQPAIIPAPQLTPSPAPTTTSVPEARTPATAPKAAAHSSKVAAEPESAKSESPKTSASTVVESKLPVAEPASQPMVIKNDHAKAAAKPIAVDTPAPSVTDIASAGNLEALPNLMAPSNTPTPVLQRLMVSQGVSRGLLVKEVQPNYPRSAVQMHIEGTVQLMANLSKKGTISAVKILSGEPLLAQAAVDAVKQWKYKPYLLNGEPVDIQTQITVNFKLPR